MSNSPLDDDTSFSAGSDTGAGQSEGFGETVGGSDRDADAVRSGADVDMASDGTRDTGGEAVGRDDLAADAERSGGDVGSL